VTTQEAESRGVVLIGGEDIVLSLNDLPSSAINRFHGTINEITPHPLGFEVMVDAGTQFYVRITRESLQTLGLRPGLKVWLSFKASNVRFVRV
jgi:molybdopterin-binding protein